MPEISEGVTEAFCKQKGTDVFESNRSIVPFITEGLLTHFFCYYDKLDSRNVLWFLEYVNKQEHLLRVQLPHLSAALRLSLSSRSTSYDSEDIDSPLLSPHFNADSVPLNMLKYFLLRILGLCGEVSEEAKMQWIPPYETEVNCTIIMCFIG